MLPVWKGCIFSLAWHCWEWPSQLFVPRCESFVGLSETKPLTNNFSPFPLFQIIFLFCILWFFFFFCPNLLLKIGSSYCLLSCLGSGMVQSYGGVPAQLLLLWSTDFPLLAEGMLPCPGCSICCDPPLPKLWDIPGWENSPQRAVRGCGVSKWAGRKVILFLWPIFHLRKQRALLSNPCFQQERRRKEEREEEREKEKDLCRSMAGISH